MGGQNKILGKYKQKKKKKISRFVLLEKVELKAINIR